MTGLIITYKALVFALIMAGECLYSKKLKSLGMIKNLLLIPTCGADIPKVTL
jgi:hypothetical protein